MTKLAIGITGRARRGKTTTAHIIANVCQAHKVSVQILSFADPIKEFLTSVIGRAAPFRGTDEERNAPIPELTWGDCSMMFRCNAEILLGEPVKPDDHPTGRLLMQLFGSEVIRQGFLADVWVRIAANRCRDFQGVTLIDDVRFPNESTIFDYVLKITRPNFPMSKHISESSVDDIPAERLAQVFDNAGSREDLRIDVEEWLGTTGHFFTPAFFKGASCE